MCNVFLYFQVNGYGFKKETYYKARGACVSVRGQMSLHHFNLNINHVLSDTAGGCWIL